MARSTAKLTAFMVSRLHEAGFYHDGGGLYLQVSRSGTKSWVYRFMLGGRQRDMGIGSFPTTRLADARTKAAACRKLKQDNIDPIDARNAGRQRVRLDAANALTFKDAATKYLEVYAPTWRNRAHRKQWASTLEDYVYPVFGSLGVQAVDVKLVMKVLEPIWHAKTETASRVRQRIESVLDWATARGYRQGDNPARWRGHLDKTLPRRSKVQKVKHQPALSHHKIGAFMESLRRQDGVAALALEFLILTACRSGEAVGACWPEIDLERAIWTVPASRIKAGKEHRVPLSPPAMALLKGLSGHRTGDAVFSAARNGQPLSNNAMLALLKRMGQTEITVHGFRSTFRDWAAECTNYPREVVEMALAHAIESKVEAAYLRSDLFLKRKVMMDEWARCCAMASVLGKIVQIQNAEQPASAFL